MGQRALTRTVGPHDDMDLAALDLEVDPVQHVAPSGRRVQPFYDKGVLGHGRTTDTLPSATLTS